MKITTKSAGKAIGGGDLTHVYVDGCKVGAVVGLCDGMFISHRFSAAFNVHDTKEAAVAALAR